MKQIIALQTHNTTGTTPWQGLSLIMHYLLLFISTDGADSKRSERQVPHLALKRRFLGKTSIFHLFERTINNSKEQVQDAKTRGLITLKSYDHKIYKNAVGLALD